MPLHPAASKSALVGALYNFRSDPFAANPGYQLKMGLYSAQPSNTDYSLNELTYGGYERIVFGVPAEEPWSYNEGTPPYAANVNTLTFPTCTSSDNQVATHWGLFYAASDEVSQILLLSGALDAPLVVANSYTPVFGAGSVIVVGTP